MSVTSPIGIVVLALAVVGAGTAARTLVHAAGRFSPRVRRLLWTVLVAVVIVAAQSVLIAHAPGVWTSLFALGVPAGLAAMAAVRLVGLTTPSMAMRAGGAR